MIDSAGRKVVVWSERKYEVYEFYKRRQRDSRIPGWTTTEPMLLGNSVRALSMYVIGIPYVSSFGEHVSTGACCRGQ